MNILDQFCFLPPEKFSPRGLQVFCNLQHRAESLAAAEGADCKTKFISEENSCLGHFKKSAIVKEMGEVLSATVPGRRTFI